MIVHDILYEFLLWPNFQGHRGQSSITHLLPLSHFACVQENSENNEPIFTSLAHNTKCDSISHEFDNGCILMQHLPYRWRCFVKNWKHSTDFMRLSHNTKCDNISHEFDNGRISIQHLSYRWRCFVKNWKHSITAVLLSWSSSNVCGRHILW